MRGHIRRRGNAWELRAYAGIDPLTKRQKYVPRTFRGGKREAEEALARFVTEVAGGSQAAQDTTVGDLIRDWLALAKRELSPTTARGYDWIVKTYITPTLGDVPLARLRTAQLDRFYANLREKGGQDGKPLSAATVRQVHAIVRRACRGARKFPRVDHRNSPVVPGAVRASRSVGQPWTITSSPTSSVTATGSSQWGHEPPMPTLRMKVPQSAHRCSPRARAPHASHS